MSRTSVVIDESVLTLSNQEKVLYPAAGFTKAQVIEYYRAISGFILPHLQGRALTLKRYPDGVGREFFFEKRCPAHHPDWVRTAEVRHHGIEPLNACVVGDLKSLIWLANLAALELHVPLARAATPATPDSVVFDLDPGEGADVLTCARVALILRELFLRLGLGSFVKTSGQKGLHVYIPLNLPGATFEGTKTFCKAVALTLQKSHPELVTSKMDKAERIGRVFINWSQNDPSKTMVCVYSLRAREKPFVSFPLPWSDVSKAVEAGSPQGLKVDCVDAMKEIAETGDLFGEMLLIKQSLPHF